jgi:hypothetical protein
MVVSGKRWVQTSVLASLSVLAWSQSAGACGGGALVSERGVVVNAQRVILSTRSSGTTDIVAQIGVPSTTADYGVLIPVPSEPTLDAEPVSALELAALDDATAPQIQREDASESSAPGCGCGAAGADSSKGGAAPMRGVTASPPMQIGPVEAVSLKGESADAISAWLAENGFALPSEHEATLASYVGAGNYFIAIRRSETAASGAPSSIGIHYTLAGDHRKLSLAFARIGAANKVAFTVFVANQQATGPSAPFAALTLDSLDATLLRTGDYQGAVEAAVQSRGSKAFVLEGVAPRELISDQAPSIAKLVDAGAVVTRATTVVAREALTEDAIFASPVQGSVPTSRWASRNVFKSNYANLTPFGVLLLMGLRRRRRAS